MSEDFSDLPLARLRWRQAGARIAERYPRVARDGQLASLFEGLGDALGVGPEAADTSRASTDIFRQPFGPELIVVVDASQCILLEVTTAMGRVVRRPVIGDVAKFKHLLDLALEAQAIALADAEEERMTGIDDKRRSEGRLTRAEAVEWLIAKGMARWQAVSIAENVYRGNAADGEGMKLDRKSVV